MFMTDLRQTKQWGEYLSKIGWKVEKVGSSQAFIRPLPLIGSLVKIQHPHSPISLKEIDKLAKKHRALFVILEPELQDYNLKTLHQHGYQISALSLTHTATIQINLSRPKKKILTSFSENARRNIKKAQKYSLKVKQVPLSEASAQDFQVFFNLHLSLTRLKKFWAPGFEEFYKKILSFKNNSSFFFAYDTTNPAPIAVLWLAYSGNKAFYLHTGATTEGYKMLANYLLVWEAIKSAHRNKVKIWDFEGIFDQRFPKNRTSWQQFTEFKKRFHGQIIEYPPAYIKCYNIIFKVFYQCSKIFMK